ncbi:MAG TPA: BTAD domain-containing putative transcriptional regulator, partial [Chloroflexota bacterium]|nr:BTAD domain-containing putative transcriptional regulator [Chloroflexota bacterium]
LPEDRYEEWAERRREELRNLQVALLLHLADLSTAEGDREEALRCLRTVLTVDPCHEDAARSLMLLLAAAERRGEALEVYRRLTKALDEELGQPPTRETRAVRTRLLAEAPSALMPSARRSNLPVPLTSFVGREWERVEITQLLRSGGNRLLTLVGPGGCGKSRLAIEVGRLLLDDYPDGVYLVELAPLTDPNLLAQAVADALGLRGEAGGDQSQLAKTIEYVSGRRLLLALDNCEHLLEGCAALAAALLQATTDLHILVTSQAVLGMLGETVWRVPSLSLPEASIVPIAELGAYEAIQLFVERARAVKPQFALRWRRRCRPMLRETGRKTSSTSAATAGCIPSTRPMTDRGARL